MQILKNVSKAELDYLTSQPTAKALIEKNEYDLVYCHTPVGGLVARFATSMIRKKRPKVVYCAHGLHFYNGAPLLNWILYYIFVKDLILH